MKVLLMACAAMLSSGCGLWYKPVPVANAIGEEQTVMAGDTVSVYRTDRFEVYAPNAEAVYDGYEQLNRAYRAFERHFGAPAPRLAVVLSPDTTTHLDSATAHGFRQRGFTLVHYVRHRGARTRQRSRVLDYGGVLWPVAPTAARAMLARFAGAQLGPDRGQPESVLLDRFPLWYRGAVMRLVGEAGASGNDLDYVRDKRSQWLPFAQLLTLVRSSEGDSALDPSRRGDTDEFTRIIAAQSSTLARFLVDREGPDVIGRLGRGYLAGRSLNEMIATFARAPTTMSALEERWKAWIEVQEN